jgi:hypothetical protein
MIGCMPTNSPCGCALQVRRRQLSFLAPNVYSQCTRGTSHYCRLTPKIEAATKSLKFTMHTCTCDNNSIARIAVAIDFLFFDAPTIDGHQNELYAYVG